MNEETQVATPESTPEDRLAAFFGTKQSATAKPSEEAVPQEDTGQPEEDTQPIADEQSQEELADEAEEAPPQVELEEVEWEGKKFQIPAELKPAVMMRADYTQKTQELQDVRKAIEAERFALTANTTFQQQVQPLLQKQAELNSYKEQAKKIDWTSLTTDQKIDLDRELRNIDQQLNELNGTLEQQKAQHQHQFGQAVLYAVQATENFMVKKVPGWDQSKGSELHNYGLQLGIPKEKLTTGWFADPVATHVMWKAQQWDKLQAGKPQVQNRAANAPPVVKPGSNAAQQSIRQNNFQKARANLKKTGSLEDAAAVFLRMK